MDGALRSRTVTLAERPLTLDGPASVLVVDDQRDAREMLTEYLTQCGYVVHTAVDGLDAIDVALHVHPSIILMDLMMPRLDGWEATRRLKADVRTEAIPILALTAAADSDCGAELAGCHSVLPKPCDLERLAETMRVCLHDARDTVPF
jgi:two-component system, cell cycle response regulator DivK